MQETEELKHLEEVVEEGFSLRVTHRHPKSGLITKKDPYILRVVEEKGGKVKYFERPVGSGNLFNRHGDPVGRWDKTQEEGKRFLKGAEHIVWVAPETEDEKLAKSLTRKDAKIKELEKELAAIKKESTKAPSKSDTKN